MPNIRQADDNWGSRWEQKYDGNPYLNETTGEYIQDKTFKTADRIYRQEDIADWMSGAEKGRVATLNDGDMVHMWESLGDGTAEYSKAPTQSTSFGEGLKTAFTSTILPAAAFAVGGYYAPMLSGYFGGGITGGAATGAVMGAGKTVLSGGNLKDTLTNGLMGGVLGGAAAGIGGMINDGGMVGYDPDLGGAYNYGNYPTSPGMASTLDVGQAGINSAASYGFDAANQGFAGPVTDQAITDVMNAANVNYPGTTFDQAKAAFNGGQAAYTSGLMGGEGGPYTGDQNTIDATNTANGGTPAGENIPPPTPSNLDPTKLIKPAAGFLGSLGGGGPTGALSGFGNYGSSGGTGSLLSGNFDTTPAYLKNMANMNMGQQDKPKTWQDYAEEARKKQQSYYGWMA